MSDRDLIWRGDAKAHPFANGIYDREHANEHFIRGHESYKEWIDTIPPVVDEATITEERKLRVSWRWLEDFAREYKGVHYAEFLLAAKRAYISSIEKLYEQWAQEKEE